VNKAAVALAGLALALGAAAIYAAPYPRLGAGYVAKMACSEIFLAGRSEAAVRAADFEDISPVLPFVSLTVDAQKRETRAHLFGLGGARAVYRDGYGCTLQKGPIAPLPDAAPVADIPLPSAAGANVDAAALDAAIEAAFADPVARTRALLVMQDGAVIAERYAAGFSASTPLLSWSMAKSVTATMVGAAALRGLVEVEKAPPEPLWRDGDPRRAITWRDLLQMQSGLAFGEFYGAARADVSRMLFDAPDAGAVGAARPLIHPPGTYWSYSSGTTNLMQRALRRTLEDQGADYHSFAREAVFAPLGMASAVLEPDSSGTFIGSSFMYATARDWAKLGQLYLDGGVHEGERLLPEGWTDFVARPASGSDGVYGAQFWLNRKGATGRGQYIPGLPEEAYMMSGHEGQYVVIVPDKRLIIVRTGTTRGAEPMALAAPVFAAIYAAVGE